MGKPTLRTEMDELEIKSFRTELTVLQKKIAHIEEHRILDEYEDKDDE